MSSIKESITKKSVCYGCGQTLVNYSMLICNECLNIECQEFETLINLSEEIKMESVYE